MKKLTIVFLCTFMLLSALPCCGADSVGLGEIRIPAAATVTLGTAGGNNTAAGGQAQASDEAVAMNALAGSWYWYSGWGSNHIWHFSADGGFVRLHATQLDYRGSDMSYGFKSQSFTKGNYRVNGHLLEFYNCQTSSDLEAGVKVWSGLSIASIIEVMNSPLKNPSADRDFSVEFEFADSMRLRLVSTGRKVLTYDAEFAYYSGDSHDVTLPAISIPSRAWPKDELRGNLPEFTEGRLRLVNTNTGRVGSGYIYFDRTSFEGFTNYVNLLVQEGWSVEQWDEKNLSALLAGNEDAVECRLTKGKDFLRVTPFKNGNFTLLVNY